MLRDRSVNNQFASVWQPKLRHCAAVIINTCTYTNTLSRALIFDFSSLFQPASVPTAPWKHTPAEHGGLTDTKISIIEQLAYKNKASNIVLQETQCTTADKLLIPSFSLPRRVLMSKKPEVAMDSESTPAGFCVLVSDTVQDPESKFVKKRTQTRSHFSVSAVA